MVPGPGPLPREKWDKEAERRGGCLPRRAEEMLVCGSQEYLLRRAAVKENLALHASGLQLSSLFGLLDEPYGRDPDS